MDALLTGTGASTCASALNSRILSTSPCGPSSRQKGPLAPGRDLMHKARRGADSPCTIRACSCASASRRGASPTALRSRMTRRCARRCCCRSRRLASRARRSRCPRQCPSARSPRLDGRRSRALQTPTRQRAPSRLCRRCCCLLVRAATVWWCLASTASACRRRSPWRRSQRRSCRSRCCRPSTCGSVRTRRRSRSSRRLSCAPLSARRCPPAGSTRTGGRTSSRGKSDRRRPSQRRTVKAQLGHTHLSAASTTP
mmetsp:Transcript_16526/g.32284  ORF Transcript_16526/g.32284 Transcript_16526/m.32284 type:complete len:255 (+) Transcript_16526:566-1330(+)